ncbi:hypothetical protein [Wenyingzhuangia aestuarii]|uniref:hypothetical protein n=1 Tax=Wenyingzhuangia aestuarii TaxID=1647582 RepID=UPI001439BAAA|nr:hypothetical protein [Wenyingzhuangia aestuarii]NJB84151.1 diphthamide synthase subunit DPH2 [Wenyingzhuangia aestuarii]
MTKDEIEKVVDELIVRLPIGKGFPLSYELSVYFISITSNLDLNKDKTHIIEDVSDFMIENEYIKHRPNDIEDFLEQKGIDAKNEGGHFKYLESLKSKREYWLTKYQMIYLILFIGFSSFGVYKYFSDKKLKFEYETLKSDFENLTSKYDSVTKQRRIPLKQIPDDSLQTKN